MSKSSEEKLKESRRGFLKFGLGSVAGGAALAAGGLKAEAAVAEQSEDNAGYSETEHVRTYYDTARF